MIKPIALLSSLFVVVCSSLFAICFDDDCCQSVECSVGWRRDDLKWRLRDIDSSYIPARVKSKIDYKDIESYTLSAKARWVGSAYYIRLSAEYGLSEKGRAEEKFKIKSYYLRDSIGVETDNPVKRRSEVYDFDGAVGYPLTFFCCRLNIIPLIGFSFHRQHIRVKEREFSCCPSSCTSFSSQSCSCDGYDCYDCSRPDHSCLRFFENHPSSSFFVESSNPFVSTPSSDPFQSSSSDPKIASALGLATPNRTQNYRFTWYGVYLGADIAYALDCCWTLYSQIEFHFLDRAHRKRKSWTGVDFVDEYHKETWAYAYNAVLGTTYAFGTCWYSMVEVNFNWWKGHAKKDELHWKTTGGKIGLGYIF